jgi:hypothetical protein
MQLSYLMLSQVYIDAITIFIWKSGVLLSDNDTFQTYTVVRTAAQIKELMILMSRIRIPPWDTGAGPSDETA